MLLIAIPFSLVFLMTPAFAQTPKCEALLKTPMAIEPLQTLEDGRMQLTLNYSNLEDGTKTVELPSFLNKLKGVANLQVLVLAGNSGTAYEKTRHNLAYAFNDYLLRVYPNQTHTGGEPFLSRETVSVSYDDETVRSWTADFRTEAPEFRTKSGEIFYFPDLEGRPALVVKMIGDYNEVGDFAIPILDALSLPPANLVLIHDELNLPETESQIFSGVQKYNGNNALFSVLRSLAYGAFPQVVEYLKTKATLPDEKWAEYESAFRAKANVRYANHLGQERAFDSAFKNVDTVIMALKSIFPEVEEQMTRPLRLRLEASRAQLSEVKRPMAGIMPELNSGTTSAERKAALSQLRDQILLASKPLNDQIKDLETQIQEAHKHLVSDVVKIVESRLTFKRLSLGTDNGAVDRSDLAGYVLSPYPQQVFTDAFWARVVNQMPSL